MRKYIYICFAAILFFNACRSKKQRAAPKVTKTIIDSSRPILPEIKNILNNSFEYDYLSFKSKCDYKDPSNSQSFTMNFRMKRDSILWISVTAVGFEVARALLDKDTVRIINRLEKKFYIYDYAYIKKLAGTSLSLLQIQNLLSANLLFPPEGYAPHAESAKYKTTEGYVENIVSLDNKSKIIEQVLQHLVEQSMADVLYTNYKKTDSQQFPGNVDISIVTPKRNMSLLMENSGMNTAMIEAFPFLIPPKYEKAN